MAQSRGVHARNARGALGLLLGGVIGVAGCADRPEPAVAPPSIEFLVASGDSTFWVRAGADGIRVQSGPLLLTRDAAQLFQLTISEDITDYLDAEFVSERLLATPIGSNDSVVLYGDESVQEARARWLSRRPGEEPIDVLEEDAPEPESSAADFLEVINVHSRWVSWAHSLDVDLADDRGHTHTRRRGVTDLRTGARATLDSLYAPDEARRLEAAGRASLDTILAVVREARDERALRARATLASFVFDATEFSLSDVATEPAIVFHVGGVGADGEALDLLLPPLRVLQEPAWWRAVRPTLPIWSADSLTVEWRTGGARVIGTVDSSRTRIALVLVDESRPDAQRAGREWPIAAVPMPTYQFMLLDSVSFDARARSALIEAFAHATDGDPFATRASWTGPRNQRRARSRQAPTLFTQMRRP